MKYTLLAATLVTAMSAQAHGDKHKGHSHDHDEKMEHVGAHVHGEAQLNVVLEGDELNLTLVTPAMNVMGFEYEPKSEKDLKVSHDALHDLEDANWLSVNGGNCKLHESEVEWDYAKAVHDHFHGDHKHEHKEGHKDDHDHKHDHDHKKDKKHDHAHTEKHDHKHDHDHDHDHAEGETHSDVDVALEYDCQSPKAVKSITLNVFDAFSGFEKLNVQWIVGDQQGAQTLTSDKRVLKLR